MQEDETFDDSEAPEGFTLEAEVSRQHEAAKAGVIERAVEPEEDDDTLDSQDEDGSADDDDAIDKEDA